jgi:hypothetical protein
MHVTNIPLILSSITFILPYFAAIDTDNYSSAVLWGALTCTSTLVHITKRPYHIHGDGNCIPFLYRADVFVLYSVLLRAIIDSWYGGIIGIIMVGIVIFYSGFLFYFGKSFNKFVFSKDPETSILSHASVHLVASFGGVSVLYMRALKTDLKSLQDK